MLKARGTRNVATDASQRPKRRMALASNPPPNDSDKQRGGDWASHGRG